MRTRIEPINGLRGLAILLVIVHHLFIPFATGDQNADPLSHSELFASFVRHASVGVDIFFMLSGFVLYLPYRLDQRRFEGRRDVLDFYVHRAKRLLPLYYIVVLVTLSLHSKFEAGSGKWGLELLGLASTLFIFSPHGFLPPSNVVLWSVSVEIWFSLAFPLVVLAILRYGIIKVLIVSIVTSFVLARIGYLTPVDGIGYLRPLTNGLFGHFFEFVAGMFLCDVYVKHPIRDLASNWGSASALLGGVIIITTVVYWDALTFARPLALFIFDIAFALIFVEAVRAESALGAIVSWKPLQLTGCMCYSIYAWHGIVMNSMIPSTSTMAFTLRMIPAFVVVLVPLCCLSYRYIEFGGVKDWRPLFLMPARSTPISTK